MAAESTLNRDWVFPTLIAAALGLPWLVSSSNSGPDPRAQLNGIYGSNNFSAGSFGPGYSPYQADSGGSPANPYQLPTAQAAQNSYWPSGYAPANNSSVPTGNSQPWSAGPILPPPGGGPLIFPGNQFQPDLSAQPLEFMPVGQLGEVFRFEITPDWITSRWDRVSRVTADSGLIAYRVPLVTGVNVWDLHGSLSYFFDQQQRLQRIQFRGWTGDTTQLAQLLTSQFQLQSRQTSWAGLYTLDRWGTTCSAALIQQPAVIRAANSNQRFAIHLELNHPQSSLAVTPETAQLVQSARQ